MKLRKPDKVALMRPFPFFWEPNPLAANLRFSFPILDFFDSLPIPKLQQIQLSRIRGKRRILDPFNDQRFEGWILIPVGTTNFWAVSRAALTTL